MKTIVVTGTSSGIGYEICTQAANLSYNVISISRNIEPLSKVNGVESHSVDITDKKSISDFVEDLSKRNIKIDILINNAGHLSNELFSETSYKSFKDTFDVNVFGLAEITRSLIPLINKTGHVINTHDMNSVMEIGDKIIFLVEGKKIWEGTNQEILNTDDKMINDFVYSSELFKKVKLTQKKI